MEIVLTGVALAAAGVVVGIFSGMLGIGGGTLMVPLLRMVFGLPAVSSAATSLFVIIPTSISGVVGHVRNKTCVVKLGIALGLGGAITSSLGVFLADRSPSWAIMTAAAIIISYSSYNMLRKALRIGPGGKGKGDKGDVKNVEAADAAKVGASEVVLKESAADGEAAEADVAPIVTAEGEGQGVEAPTFTTRRDLITGFFIGMVAGLASGYVGVGGGFIMVPLMTSLLNVPMHKATGTSLVAILILAIPGVAEYCLLGHVDYLAGIMLAIGSIPGASIGAKLGSRIPERQLRLVFAAFLVVAAAGLIVNEMATLG